MRSRFSRARPLMRITSRGATPIRRLLVLTGVLAPYDEQAHRTAITGTTGADLTEATTSAALNDALIGMSNVTRRSQVSAGAPCVSSALLS